MPAPLLLMIALASAPAPATVPTLAPPEGDLAKIQGKWKGFAGPEKDIEVTFEFKESEVTVSVKSPDGQDHVYKGKVKLDEKADPKAIDLVEFKSDGESDLADSFSLYQVDGDTFKLCTAGPKQERPTEFKEDPTKAITILTFTKVKG